MRHNIVFPTLKPEIDYDVIEYKYCEQCSKQFVRLVGSESRECGLCKAKNKPVDKLWDLAKMKAASKRKQ